MKYIIHSNIVFDTTEYILTSLNESNLLIKLSNSAGRVLEELIKYRDTNSPVTREHLFKVVWKNHGLAPSNGNLNQQISLIRKTLNTFGLDPSSIITVPKRGLKINNKLVIKNTQENSKCTTTSSNHAINQNNNTPTAPVFLSFKTHIKYIISLTIMFIIMFSISLLYTHNKPDHIKLYCCKEINSCNICSIPTTPGFECIEHNTPYFEIT